MQAYKNYIPPREIYTEITEDKKGNITETFVNKTFDINESTEGESIEKRVERIMNNNEPITDGAPTIYTERKDGVIPEYDIRTDRFDHALDMTDKITKDALAKRAKRQEDRTKAQSNDQNSPNQTQGAGPTTPEPAK